MAKRYTRSTAITAERAAGRRGRYEHRVQGAEREELVKPIDQRRLGPAVSRRATAKATIMDNGRVRPVARRRGANAIVKTPRQSAILLLGSVAVDTAEPVAAPRRTIRTPMGQRNGDQKKTAAARKLAERSALGMVKSHCNLGCSDESLCGSTVLWRTMPIDRRLPLSRKE